MQNIGAADVLGAELHAGCDDAAIAKLHNQTDMIHILCAARLPAQGQQKKCEEDDDFRAH